MTDYGNRAVPIEPETIGTQRHQNDFVAKHYPPVSTSSSNVAVSKCLGETLMKERLL
jgi:hypothetical protein